MRLFDRDRSSLAAKQRIALGQIPTVRDEPVAREIEFLEVEQRGEMSQGRRLPRPAPIRSSGRC